MKFRVLLLLTAGLSLVVPALAQSDQKTQAPTQSQTQPAASQDQPAPSQPTASQSPSQPAQSTADQSSTQKADQDSSQNQDIKPAVDQPQTTPADQNGQSQAQTKDPKAKHDGSKKNVDAIGNRKVGAMDWYSIEPNIKVAKTTSAAPESPPNLLKQPVIT